jgi:tetratricopeptide (TPR) repeat protein
MLPGINNIVMKKLIFLIFLFSGCSAISPLQKSKFIAVFHLIETANYEEAKKVIEEMKSDDKSSQWARTWYARGLLCQTAYQDGMRNNDRKKFELYPDQLYVAYTSYERARIIDRGGRLEKQLAPRYVYLANEFQKIAERHFRNAKYDEALRAYEQAVIINKNPILSVQIDKNLIYNTALAAYESNNRDKAIEYLTQLNEAKHSTNVLHLLFLSHLEKGDTLAARKILSTNLNRYADNQDLVLVLVDLLYQQGEIEEALTTLDNALKAKPNQYIFLYTKGLIYQKKEQYANAIESYKNAEKLAPEELLIHLQIATCYYNIGVEIEENSRAINNSIRVLEEKAKSTAAFNSAISWLDKAYDMKPDNPVVIMGLFELYKALSVSDKVSSMQSRIN